jgi:hypothetical protein
MYALGTLQALARGQLFDNLCEAMMVVAEDVINTGRKGKGSATRSRSFEPVGRPMAATRTVRKGDQPLPIPGAVDVGPEVVADVLRYGGLRSTEIVESVAEDFRARIQLGIERYGHPLQTHNGRDALRDTRDELLDAAHYLKQAHLETRNPKIHLAYVCVLGLIFDLKELTTDG